MTRSSSQRATDRHSARRGAGRSIAVALVILGLFAPRAAPAAEIAPIRFQLENGLTVLVVEQHALPIVHIQALVKAGAAQDPPGKSGLANLVASLLDEGTKTRSSKNIAEQIEFVGGTLSAKAEDDFSTSTLRVLKKDVERGMTLLADILRHPSFPRKELDRVRRQTLGQIQSEEDDPGTVASKAFHELVFAGHPYRWPVIGTETTLPQITRTDLLSLHKREYLPNQTILAMVGDLTAEEARALVKTHFGSWPAAPAPARTVGPAKPIERTMTRLIDKDLTQATIMLGHVGISRSNEDFYAVTVMNYILGAGGFSSRLMDSVRDNQGLVYGIHSAFDANLLPGPFTISLQTRNQTANQALAGVLTEVKRMREEPVSDQELAEAKSYLIGSFPLRFDTTGKLAEVLTLVELHGLGLDYFSQYPRWIEHVTKDDVLRVAREYLHPDRYALVVVGKLSEANVNQQP